MTAHQTLDGPLFLREYLHSDSLTVGVCDTLFLFLQPAQLSSKENTLVWIAVSEDGVSILDHRTMV